MTERHINISLVISTRHAEYATIVVRSRTNLSSSDIRLFGRHEKDFRTHLRSDYRHFSCCRQFGSGHPQKNVSQSWMRQFLSMATHLGTAGHIPRELDIRPSKCRLDVLGCARARDQSDA